MRSNGAEQLLLRVVAVTCALGGATAQTCLSGGATFVQEGYDFSGVSENDDSMASFDVTGIKCATGYASSNGGQDAAAIVCSDADTAYTATGCLPCTSGVGLCDSTSTSPNQVRGDLVYFQDIGVTSAEINWRAPTTGTYSSPILGYKIQMKQLCQADVSGTSVTDLASNSIDYLQSAVYDCAGTYTDGFTEPVVATDSTSLGSWVDVTGVYTPTSGQNHDAECHTSCATTSCSNWADDAAILHTTTGCSGCMPQNPETDVGCFPGADGYPTAVGVVHRIGGLTSNTYYAFRIAAFNHFGTGAWSTQSYAVHTHSVPKAPTWATAPVTNVVAAGTAITLNWQAGDAYGSGTDECQGRDVYVTGVYTDDLELPATDANGRALSTVDDYYNGMVITTSNDNGQSRVITGYDKDTRVVTVSSAFDSVTTGATFTIGPGHTMTAILSCSRSKAEIFADCDTDHNAVLSSGEATACTCISAEGDGSFDGVTYVQEPCSTAGYGSPDDGSETSSGTHTYTIQQCTGNACSPTVTIYTTTSTAGYQVTSLTAGTTYVFKVTATNAAGSTSSETTTYTTPSVPEQPDPPVAMSIDGTSIKLTWRTSIDKIVSTVSGHNTVGPDQNGFILYAQSEDTSTNPATWAAAVRGSLTHDGEDTIAAAEYALGRSSSATNPNIAYASDSDSTVTDDNYLQLAYFSAEYYTDAAGAETVKPGSTWNQRGLTNRQDVIDTVVVPSLLPGTKYRFKVALVNAAGTSVLSDVSAEYTTPDSAISTVRIYSGPPCVYKPGQGSATTFAASAAGSNVKYRWELVSESTTGQSTLYSDATMMPGGSTVGTCLDGDTCSVMEYALPYPGDDSSSHANYDEIKLRVLASNGRGIVAEEIAFGYNTLGRSQLTGLNTIEYCGCTDPGDDLYWSEATYMVPSLCTTDTFDSALSQPSEVAAGDWEYFQFFFDADSYAAEVTVRVDVGTVDVYVSTSEIPDSSLPHTYSASETGISNFYVAPLSYTDLSTSTQRSVFVAVLGSSGFSRFQVLGRSSEFQLAPGSDSPASASRERLQDVTTSPAGITKTVVANGWNFYEYYYPHSENDIDVQITVTSATAAADGLLDVFASLEERYPSAQRATSSSSGYWTGTGHSQTDVSSAGEATLTFTIRPTSHTGSDGALFVGVNGKTPAGWAVGDELPSSTYTIKAKVFRYTIVSSLLDPVVEADVASVAAGTTVSGSIGDLCNAPCTAPTLSSSASSVDDFYVGMVMTVGYESETGTMDAALTLQGGNSHATTLDYYKDWSIVTTTPVGTGIITGSSAADPPVLTVSWNSFIETTAATEYALTPPASQQTQSLTVIDYVGATKVATVRDGFTRGLTTASTFSIRVTGTDAVARTVAAEDRYAVASTDNFNYYEIVTSDATKSLSLTLIVHYGTAKLFTSSTTLPTQDLTVSNLVGTYAASTSESTVSIPASNTNIEGKYVYLGVLADGGDVSYDLVVTENTFGIAAPTQLYWCDEGTDVRSYTTSTVAADAACTTLPGALFPVCDDDGTSSSIVCPLCTEALATLTGVYTDDLELPATDANGRALSTVDDYYNGMVITTSNDNGQSRVITGYDKDTRVVTVSSAFDSVTTGATFTINTGVCEPSDCMCSAGNTLGADTFTTIPDNDGAGNFFALYVGTEDTNMQTASRSGMGSLPDDITGSASSWGLDWTMPMTTTWIDSNTDEWDMDVDISFARGGLQTGEAQDFRVFASTRERYPSDERAYDTAVATASVHYDADSMYSQAGLQGKGFATSGTGSCTLLEAESTVANYGECLAACDALDGCNAAQFTTTGTKCQLFSCPSNAASYLVDDESDDQTYLKSTDTSSLVVPMYTFSGNWVYINIENSDALSGHLQITKTEKVSGRDVTADTTTTTLCTNAFCNYNGKCIDHDDEIYCICSDGYSGSDCSIKAFSTATTISTSDNFVGTVATGYKYGANAPFFTYSDLTASAEHEVTGTMSAPLTLTAGATVSTAPNYYLGWTITTATPIATGTITSSTSAGVLEITWTNAGVTTSSSTTYVLIPPVGCRTQHQWQQNGALNGVEGTLAGSLELSGGYSTYDDYYNGLTITVTAGDAGAGTYTITDYDGATKTFEVAETGAAATDSSSGFIINTCATGHTWDDGTKICTRKSGSDTHEWEPFVYIGEGYLQHCTAIENLVVPTTTVGDCQALCPADSACNAFVHDGTNAECKLYTCPTGSAPVTSADATEAGSWGSDDSDSNKKAYHRQPLTCCASDVDNVANDATSCANPVSGYYDKASCETVVGVTTAGACEQSAVTSRAACEDAPTSTAEATCELKPFDEVPDPACSPTAILAGKDGSSSANSCDAYDVVSLDCSTQKCTPSPSTANPYKIGYVSCVGGACTINAPKSIVEVPFTVAGLPEYSKVLAYVDSKPYPSKGANALHYTYNCEASDTSCVSMGKQQASTCEESAAVSDATTRTLCAAVSGGSQVACEAITGCTYTAASMFRPPFVDSSIKIYDLQPLPTGKKHTLVLMLLTSEGEPLGTVLKQFEVGYAGGCTVAPDGSVCGNQGACHLGYCVCYDGYFGIDCERNIDEDGSVCAAKSSTTETECINADGNGATPGFGNYECDWDATTELCSIQVVTTGFTAGGVYQARQTQLANSKLGEARFLNTRMLEANAAEIKQSDNAIAAGTLGTKTKLETVAASVVATVAASKSATQTKVDALYAKAERNAIKVQQAKEESLRLQTTNLEAKLEMQRSLADHQTQVQNRFQSKRFDVYKLNAQKQDKLKQEFARTRFTLNQLLTSNGPTVDPTQFKQSTCTTDQFYNVVCSESTVDQSASFAGTGYVSGQTVDTAASDGTRTAPVIAIEGEDTVGYYNDVSDPGINRGR